jgi:hypothetical protein
MFMAGSSGNWTGLAVGAVVGVGIMAVGIPLLVAGIVRKRRAGRMKQGLAMVEHRPRLEPALPVLVLGF